ncbi:MAG TPA: hypothetical protein VGD67_24635 [Pseudonocardiaceae bacterium]
MEHRFRHGPPADLGAADELTVRRLRWLSLDEPPGIPSPRPPSTEPMGYEAIDDPEDLRIAIRELRRVRAWIGQFADVAAEMPDFAPESAVGARATTAVVTLLIERAEARLRVLARRTSFSEPPDGAGVIAAG